MSSKQLYYGGSVTLSSSERKKLLKLSSNNPGVLELLLKKEQEAHLKVEKKKLRKSLKKRKNSGYKERSGTYQEKRDKAAEEFKSQLIKNQTKSEKRFKAYLKALKINYEFQKVYMLPAKFYIVDFYLPDYNIVIEIDGAYHSDKKQLLQDEGRTAILKKYGVLEVMRFTNDEVFRDSSCLERLQKEFK